MTNGPGIEWEPGEEDDPVPALPDEDAMAFLQRWLDDAAYARLSSGGAKYIHETDVLNLVNHVTADYGLIDRRIAAYGDRIISSRARLAAIEHLDAAISLLEETRRTIEQGGEIADVGEAAAAAATET